MMKKILLLCFSILLLSAKSITYQYELNATANVTGMVSKGDIIYAGTDVGVIDVINWKDKKRIDKVELPKIHDFMGDLMGPKIISIDISDDGKKILFLAQAEGGSNHLYIYENKKINKVIDKKDVSILMSKASFVSDDKVVIVSLSSEIVLYDLKNKKELYHKQLSESSFGDFTFNEDKSKVAVGCESGEIFIVETKSGKILKVLNGANKDKVMKLSFKKGKILSGGQDRQAGIYNVQKGSFDVIKSNFLVYTVALSPDAKMAAFCYDEDNDIAIFGTDDLSMKYLLKGAKSTLNTILYIDKNTLISSSDDNFILVWKID